jgi:hypothetical protein
MAHLKKKGPFAAERRIPLPHSHEGKKQGKSDGEEILFHNNAQVLDWCEVNSDRTKLPLLLTKGKGDQQRSADRYRKGLQKFGKPEHERVASLGYVIEQKTYVLIGHPNTLPLADTTYGPDDVFPRDLRLA